jgi:hypothetical protein
MFKKILIISFLSIFLTGCATDPNVQLKNQFWQAKKKTVVVAGSTLPKPQLYQQGAQGILDIAISSAVTDGFSKYLSSFDLQPITDGKKEFVRRLRDKNMQVVISDDAINLNNLQDYKRDTKRYATKNFTQLNGQFDADDVLIISVKKIGAVRNYYGFIPLGAPKAFCNVEGQLVDLQTNEILWLHNAEVMLDVAGNWDQPTTYPNFSSTLNNTINMAKDELINDFFLGGEIG